MSTVNESVITTLQLANPSQHSGLLNKGGVLGIFKKAGHL